MSGWFAIPRYREHPMWLVTLDCGHSGPLDPWVGILDRVAGYECPWCDGIKKLTRSVRLGPTRRPA